MAETTGTQYFRVAPWRIPLWSLATAVNNMFLMVMMFVSYVAAGGYGIAVAVAGMLVTGTRIFDGITDPILALIGDKLKTRYGKVRILLTLGYAIMCLSVGVLFFWGIGTNIAVFITAYIVYIIGYTIFGNARMIGEAVITNDPVQRPKVFRYSQIWVGLISVGIQVYMSMVLARKYGGLKIEAFQELALLAIITGTALIALAMIAVSPRDKPENFTGARKEPVTLKDCWNLLKGNRPLQLYIVAASSDKLALQTASQSAITTMLFGIVIGNYAFNGQQSMIALVPNILLIFLASRMAGRRDAKHSLVFWTWTSIAVTVLIFAFMAFSDTTKISVVPVYTVVFIVLNCLRSSATMATSTCTEMMRPDLADYELSRSGNYMPATVAGVFSFVDKLISSFASTIVGFCVAAIGYTTVMPQPNDPSTPAIFWMTIFLWLGVPVIGWICTIVAMKFYPLDGAKMREIQIANKAARDAISG
jgi:Na+/melibiose symporter-like transporter